MKFIMSDTNHDFKKVNLVTLSSDNGQQYDVFKCEKCELKGKSYSIGVLTVKSRKNYESIIQCSENKKIAKQIVINRCTAYGSEFFHLIPDSIHDVLDMPKKNSYSTGYWVMGVTEPVFVLSKEIKEIIY